MSIPAVGRAWVEDSRATTIHSNAAGCKLRSNPTEASDSVAAEADLEPVYPVPRPCSEVELEALVKTKA